jgi:hypothetical protein
VIFDRRLGGFLSFVESDLGKHGYIKIIQSGYFISFLKNSNGKHNVFHVSLIGPHQRNQ